MESGGIPMGTVLWDGLICGLSLGMSVYRIELLVFVKLAPDLSFPQGNCDRNSGAFHEDLRRQVEQCCIQDAVLEWKAQASGPVLTVVRR